MSLFLILWFADLCDNVAKTLLIFIFIGIVLLLISAMLISDAPSKQIEENYKKTFIKYFKKYGLLLLIIASINFIFPSSKTVYIATGINAVTEATKTVAESATAKKAIELLNIKLDEYLKDAKK